MSRLEQRFLKTLEDADAHQVGKGYKRGFKAFGLHVCQHLVEVIAAKEAEAQIHILKVFTLFPMICNLIMYLSRVQTVLSLIGAGRVGFPFTLADLASVIQYIRDSNGPENACCQLLSCLAGENDAKVKSMEKTSESVFRHKQPKPSDASVSVLPVFVFALCSSLLGSAALWIGSNFIQVRSGCALILAGSSKDLSRCDPDANFFIFFYSFIHICFKLAFNRSVWVWTKVLHP